MSKIKKNFFYVSVYNLFNMLLPLVTSPILSRRLGAEALGVYTYIDAVVSVFVAFAATGVYRFGMREIAKVRDNKEDLSQVFIDIWFINICNVIVVILVYIAFVFVFDTEYRIYFFIRSGTFLVCIFDTAFLYCGLENMKQVTIRDASAKIAIFTLIILFIRDKNDLILYFIIMTAGSVFAVVVGFIYGRRYISLKKPCLVNCARLYKPMIIMLIPVLASTIYHTMDKIMIGFLHSTEDVGYYELACKALIPKTIISAFGIAMCPHLTALYSSGKNIEADRKVRQTFLISLIMSYAFMFGVCAIANEFAPLFWGVSFARCSSLMIGLSVAIPLWCVGEVIRTQYLLPNSRDNEYSITFITGVVVNTVFNILFIPSSGALGAIVATLAAEAAMSIFQLFLTRKEIPALKYIIQSAPYFVIGIVMVVAVRLVARISTEPSLVFVLLEVITGVVIFTVLIIIYEALSKNGLITDIIWNQCKQWKETFKRWN